MAAPAPQARTFSRALRIQQGRDFARIRREGERRATGCMIANWRRLEPGAAPRLGVITSSRMGNAVVRNRARRLLREAFRLHRQDLMPVDLVLVARSSIVGKRFADVEKDFVAILGKTGLLKQ